MIDNHQVTVISGEPVVEKPLKLLSSFWITTLKEEKDLLAG